MRTQHTHSLTVSFTHTRCSPCTHPRSSGPCCEIYPHTNTHTHTYTLLSHTPGVALALILEHRAHFVPCHRKRTVLSAFGTLLQRERGLHRHTVHAFVVTLVEIPKSQCYNHCSCKSLMSCSTLVERERRFDRHSVNTIVVTLADFPKNSTTVVVLVNFPVRDEKAKI